MNLDDALNNYDSGTYSVDQKGSWEDVFFGRFKDPWNHSMVRKGCNFNDWLISYDFFSLLSVVDTA